MKINNSISSKVIIILLLSNILIMTGVSFYSYISERNEVKQDINEKANKILDRISNSLLHPLWYLNNIEIDKTINLEMADKNVLSIILKDENKKFYMGKIKNERWNIVDYIPEKIDALYYDYELLTSVVDNNKKSILNSGYTKKGHYYILNNNLEEEIITGIKDILFDLYNLHNIESDARLKKDILVVENRNIIKNEEIIGNIQVFFTKHFMNIYLIRIIIRIIIQTLIVSILISIIIFFSLKIMILNHLISLDMVVSKFAKGDFNQRAKIESTDEIGKLANAFNDMVNKIKESFDTIQQKNLEIRENNEHLEEQVRNRTIELKRANEQKTTFFANIAHETKTPLTLIKNYMEKYIKTRENDKELQIVKNNIDKLLINMINYLDSTKLEQNQINFNHNIITNFSLIVMEKVILFMEIAKRKNVTLRTEIEKNICIKIDPEAADRIVNNLIDNAIKYTESNGDICVCLKSENNKVIFCVIDTGIGMSEEQCNSIFNPFYQLSHNKRTLQGLGMGLYIVKKISDSLGSKIFIKSEAGKGSKFTLNFDRYIPKEKEEVINDFTSSNSLLIDSIIPEVKEENITDDKDNIFVIDDNMEMLLFLKDSLKDIYNVYFAENGKQALEKIENISDVKVIISDVMMSEMDGFEFFEKIKSNDKYNTIPFIFLTAKTSEEEKINALSKGAIDYIYKPFSIEELIAKINSIIKNKKNQFNKDLVLIQQKFNSFMKNINSNTENDYNEIKKKMEYIFYQNNITSSEKEIIFLILDGLQNKEIAYELKKSIKTIEKHIYQIYRKLNVSTRVEMVNVFLRNNN